MHDTASISAVMQLVEDHKFLKNNKRFQSDTKIMAFPETNRVNYLQQIIRIQSFTVGQNEFHF